MNKKIITIILLVAIMLMTFNTYCTYAVETIPDPITDPSAWDPSKSPNANADSPKFKTMVGKILGYINTIGVVLSVIIIIIVGIRYFLGSIEEKAEYKKTILGYVIGAALLFWVTTIPNILYQIGTSI